MNRLFANGCWILLWAVASNGCAVNRSPIEGRCEQACRVESNEEPEETAEESDWPAGKIVFYPWNRLLDAGDLLRVGVNIGPGLGIDAQATGALRGAAIADTSAGVGFEGLRHLPVCVRSRVRVGAGPVVTPSLSIFDWPRHFGDVGLELHAFLAGAHLFINPFQFVDFAAGWLGMDPADDDW